MSSVEAAVTELIHRQHDMLVAWAALQSMTPPAPPRDLMGKPSPTAVAWHRAAAAYSERSALFHAAQDGVRVAEIRVRMRA